MSALSHDPSMVGKPRYERIPNDAYDTIEPWVTEAVIPFLFLLAGGTIWEPAAGAAHMVKVLYGAGFDVIGSDIAPREPQMVRRDFFADSDPEWLSGVDAIITNPPYDCAEKFVRHALDLSDNGRRIVAMLLRNEWDCAGSRSDLFRFPFARKIVLTSRPHWTTERKASPRHNFAWFMWDQRWGSSPEIRYAGKPKVVA